MINDTAPPTSITAVILAAGQSLRFGPQDKAWALINQRPMVQRIIATLMPQVDELMINCQPDDVRYQALGLNCIYDDLANFQGPLAGIDAALQRLNQLPLQNHFVVFIPCDTPNIPNDLIKQLCRPLLQDQTDICYAADKERSHYLCCAIKLRCSGQVKSYLDQGQRSMRGLINQLNSHKVVFEHKHYFANINSQRDLEQLSTVSEMQPA